MKLGRNDPCHCGSGRKYKRCHYESDRGQATAHAAPETSASEAIEEYVDPRTAQMVVTRYQTPDFSRRVDQPARQCRDGLLVEIAEGLEGRDAAEALERFLVSLEESIAEIAGRHSRLYWLHLTRRLLPDAIGDSSEWTVQLYRRILTLAVLKHGAPNDADQPEAVPLEGGGISLTPGDVTVDDVVDAHALEYLAHEYNAAASAYRRVCKGAKLVAVDGDFRAVASPELQQLITLLDDRVARYTTVGAQYGAAFDDSFPEQAGADAPMIIVGVAPNTEHSSEALEGMTGIRFTGGSNFVPTMQPAEIYRNVLIPFESHLKLVMGSSPDAMLATVWGLTLHLVTHLRHEPGLSRQIFSTGYLVSTKGELLDGVYANVADFLRHWWERIRGEQIDQAVALALVNEAITSLTYAQEDLADISLWDRTPFRLVIDAGPRVIIDLAAIPMIMSGLFEAVGFDTPSAEGVKGDAFENEVARHGQEAGFTLWPMPTEFKFTDGTKKEGDVAFLVADTLMIVECKAFSQNKRVERGQFAALRDRWEALHDKHLKQAQTLAERLDANRSGRNYEIPSCVTRIDYCVCTPIAEWIPSRDAELWLTDRIPRICTPDELVDVLGQIRDVTNS